MVASSCLSMMSLNRAKDAEFEKCLLLLVGRVLGWCYVSPQSTCLYPCASVNLCIGVRGVMSVLDSWAKRELWVLRVSENQPPHCRPAWLPPCPWLEGLNPYTDLLRAPPRHHCWNTNDENDMERIVFWSFETQTECICWIMPCYDSSLVKPFCPENPVGTSNL